MANLKRTTIPLMLIGDGQIGKTSLALRLTGNKFNDAVLTTIGKESYIYETEIHGNKIKMKIWDTAGQERFKSIAVNYFRTSNGFIFCYDITNKKSFESIQKWVELAFSNNDSHKVNI